MSDQMKEVQSCSSRSNTASPVLPADVPTLCRCCGGLLDAKYQHLGLPDKPGYWIVTCWNRSCPLVDVTRSAASYLTFDLSPYLIKEQAS